MKSRHQHLMRSMGLIDLPKKKRHEQALFTQESGLSQPQKSSDGHYERRHSRWYEILLLNGPFQILAGWCVVALIPAALIWGLSSWRYPNQVQINTLWAISLSFALIYLTLHRIARFTGGSFIAHVFHVVSAVFLLAFAVLFFTRSGYSRPVLLLAYLFSLFWYYADHLIGTRYRRLKMAVLPMEESDSLRSTANLEIHHLEQPDLRGARYDAVVANLRNKSMGAEWERFLAECILAQIPVLHIRQVMENLTGRVQIRHLSENELGTLLPSPLYVICKRLLDILAVLVSLPITIPLMLVTALAIRLDSPGPALFIQDRVGLGNVDFRILKFRSMFLDAEADGARLARKDDARITRVGRFIRKARLDELPQLWNVLKGDMSLIGPRPEQRMFADQFSIEIPFYIYRHVVRPGITGWAQVMHGYADSTDATRIKLEHDFYYIKYFSMWLDILIMFKTIRTVVTGFGAR